MPKQPLEVCDDKLAKLREAVRRFYWNRELRGEVCEVNHYRQTGSYRKAAELLTARVGQEVSKDQVARAVARSGGTAEVLRPGDSDSINRANGQLYQGKRTQIGWTAKEIVLPTIAGSQASGAIIKVAGLTGRIRGMMFKRPDGKTVRPALVVLDRPSTRVERVTLAWNREKL